MIEPECSTLNELYMGRLIKDFSSDVMGEPKRVLEFKKGVKSPGLKAQILVRQDKNNYILCDYQTECPHSECRYTHMNLIKKI